MRRAILFPVFFLVIAAAAAAIYFAQRQQKTNHVSANALVDLAADAQRDLTLAPMRLTRLSDQEEIAIGQRLQSQYALLDKQMSPKEQILQDYVRQVGAELAIHAHRPMPYEFHLIPNQNMINAFALPGGPVYVGEGLTDLMLTEDELASVLAHEVEHIDHYHAVERVQIEAQLKHLDLEVVGDLVQLPLSLWEAGYHKDEELEADREGMFLAVAAGYSPYGAVKMMENFAKLQKEYVIHAETPEQELSELAIQGLQGYFRTHPMPSERLDQANRIIAEQHWETRSEQKPFHLEYELHNGEVVSK
ncbi:MAG TPA: M48 family metalloprotease [Candidatus Sulfotelmatobacter sp.]|nr:M48 family metalloprotease [Candidatus Sulfotelmatobacter sp.]